MEKAPWSGFVRKDGTIDTERAIAAGHDARTAAILVFATWFSSVLKTATYREAGRRM